MSITMSDCCRILEIGETVEVAEGVYFRCTLAQIGNKMTEPLTKAGLDFLYRKYTVALRQVCKCRTKAVRQPMTGT